MKNKVKELLIKNGKEKISKKMTPAIFEFLWDFVKSEPSMCSHLLTGDNIFCVFENNETKYIKINPSQTAPLQKREVEKKFYSTPSTFFWMLTSLKETSEIKIKGKTFGSSLVAIYN